MNLFPSTISKNSWLAFYTVLLIASFFSVGFHQFDEHFQILEFANYKLGFSSADALPWEYDEQMRPTFQAFLVFLFGKIMLLFGIYNPFSLATFLRILTAMLSISAIHISLKHFLPGIKETRFHRCFVLLTLFLWFSIYLAVRFSSESWSAWIFFIGFCLSLQLNKKSYLYALSVGALIGLAFICRYQVGLMAAGFGLWLLIINKLDFKKWFAWATGITLIIGIGIFIDRWFYGEWVLSSWNYLEQNLIEGKLSNFGNEPWWFYFEEVFIKGIPPFSFLYLLAPIAVMTFQSRSAVTWTILPFIVLHLVVGHKETRFLFPLLPFIPWMIIALLDLIKNKLRFESKLWLISRKAFWVVNAVLLTFVCFKPADNYINLYKAIYSQNDKPISIYYIDKNPYERLSGLFVNFYMPADFEMNKIELIESVPKDFSRNHLIIFDYKSYEKHAKQLGDYQRVYSNLPSWVRRVNYNDWLGRTKQWYLYEKVSGF